MMSFNVVAGDLSAFPHLQYATEFMIARMAQTRTRSYVVSERLEICHKQINFHSLNAFCQIHVEATSMLVES